MAVLSSVRVGTERRPKLILIHLVPRMRIGAAKKCHQGMRQRHIAQGFRNNGCVVKGFVQKPPQIRSGLHEIPLKQGKSVVVFCNMRLAELGNNNVGVRLECRTRRRLLGCSYRHHLLKSTSSRERGRSPMNMAIVKHIGAVAAK